MPGTLLISFTFKNTTGYFGSFCDDFIKDVNWFNKFDEDMLWPITVNVNMSDAAMTFSYAQKRDVNEELVLQLLKESCPHSMRNDWKKLWDHI